MPPDLKPIERYWFRLKDTHTDNHPNLLLYPRSDSCLPDGMMKAILKPWNAIPKSYFESGGEYAQTNDRGYE